VVLLPVHATGRGGRAGEKGRKRKAFPILERTWKAVCLRALSVEELSRSSRAGFLAFGSSQVPKPSHPDRSGQWRAFEPSGTSLADHSGGTAADSHGLSFYPRFARGATGTFRLSKTANRIEPSTKPQPCQRADSADSADNAVQSMPCLQQKPRRTPRCRGPSTLLGVSFQSCRSL